MAVSSLPADLSPIVPYVSGHLPPFQSNNAAHNHAREDCFEASPVKLIAGRPRAGRFHP